MKLSFITQKQLDDSVGIKLGRIWKFWRVTGIHSNAAADPTYPYDNVYLFRCPWFSIGFCYGLGLPATKVVRKTE